MKFDHLMGFLNGCVQNSVFEITTTQLKQFDSESFQPDLLTKEELKELMFVKNFKETAQRFRITSDLLQTLEANYNPKGRY